MSLENYPSKFKKGLRPSGVGRLLVMDSETIGLLHAMSRGYYKGDKEDMHVIVCQDLISKEVFVFFDPYEKRRKDKVHLDKWEDKQDGYLYDGMCMLKEADAIISHNFSGFDAIGMEIIFGKDWSCNYMERRGKKAHHVNLVPNRIMDTLVMSRLLNPDRKLPHQAYAMGASCGAHTIEAHGIRIGRYKPENEDWTTLTDHMIHRCIEDVAIGRDYYLWLMTTEWKEHEARGANPRTGLRINSAYRMELQESFNMARQEYRGWRLDMPKAINRHEALNDLIDKKIKDFRPHMPMRIKSEMFKPAHQARLIKDNESYMGTDWFDDCTNPSVAWAKYNESLQVKGEVRKAVNTSTYKIANAKGDIPKKITARYPRMRGFISDYTFLELEVVGAFSPVDFEDIPLGNRDTVKQVIYPYGWRAVDFNDTDSEYLNENGHLKNPWSGKLNERSMISWEERSKDSGKTIPEWCKGIADWYIFCSRNGQILNREDVANFTERRDEILSLDIPEYEKKEAISKLEFKKQINGKCQIRGLVARAYNFELGMEAQDYFKLTGVFPTNGSTDPIKHDDNWRVPAIATSIGTNTFRMRHKNVVNIPSRGLYPLRDLFIASKGKMILGCDGSGLELRMLAHFMNDAEYMDVVLNGDIHTHNQNKAGLPLRDMAKTFIYAFLYGSGIPNLAAVCGMSESEMRATVERFKEELPALTKLISGIEKAGKEYGYMLAVDGRWGRIRKKDGEILVHTILNVLLQMTGSLCMKYSQCHAEKNMINEGVGLDSMGYPSFLANVHDEVQMEVNADEVEELVYIIAKDKWKEEEKAQHLDSKGRMWSAPTVISKSENEIKVIRTYHRAGELLALGMVWAGEFLKIRCPLAGEYKIGKSWHDTH